MGRHSDASTVGRGDRMTDHTDHLPRLDSWAAWAEDTGEAMQKMATQLRIHADTLARLEAWKAEAITVLDQWEAVWEAAGRPGPIGRSKADSVRRLLEQRKDTP